MTGPDPFGGRVLVVSGKGGTGKTTVAAACAMAAARTGRRVLLTEVEGRDGIAGLLEVPAPGFEERPTRWEFSILSVTPREALLEYLWLFFRMRAVARTLKSARVLETVTDGVPGFRDLMAAGKLYELTEWRDRERKRPHYDLVVVDAPPSGQIVSFLKGPQGFRDLIRVGRAHKQLLSIDRLIRERTRLLLVAIPEEMSVQETAETASELRREGLPFTAVVANQVRPPLFGRGTKAAALRMEPARLVELISAAGGRASEASAAEVLQAAASEDARVHTERRRISRLREIGALIELPFLFSESFGPQQVEALAGELVP
jgi:anion-transporting  ArsA/GET3 family ATPase